MKTITTTTLAILIALAATAAHATSITFGAVTDTAPVTGTVASDGDVAIATMNYRGASSGNKATAKFQFTSTKPFTVTHTGFTSNAGGVNGLILFAGHGTTGTGLIGATNCQNVGLGPIGPINCQLIDAGTTGTSYGGTFAAGAYTLVLHEGNGDPSANSVTATLTAVPLPAAAWLFLSALGGLGVVARRKRAA